MRHLLAAAIAASGLCAILALAPVGMGAVHSTPSAGGAHYRFLADSAAGAFDLTTSVRAPGAGEVRVCFAYRSPQDHTYVRLTRNTVALLRVQGGKTVELAPPHRLDAPLAAQPILLAVKRRPEKIGVVVRGSLALVVGDLDSGEGKVGVSTAGAMQAEPLLLQPVEPPAFSDDFMREAKDPSPWETVSGQWNTTTVGDVARSANAFSYRGSGTPGMVVTGYPFWDDYVLHASFRAADAEGAAGLCLYYQDPKNYLSLVWSSEGGLRLQRVRNGAVTVLARKPVAWVLGQWYRLSVQAYDGRLAALVDGKLCLEAVDSSFGRGKIGLYVEGKEVYFDDIAVKPAVYFREPSPMGRRERWIRAGAAHIAGSLAWQDYRFRAQARPTDAAGIGMVFGWQGPNTYYLFRWGAGGGRAHGAGRKQILRIGDGKRLVVADAPGGYQIGRAYQIEIDFRPGYAAVSIDGRRALDTADPLLARGAVGLSPLTPAVREIVVVLYEEPPPPEDGITEEFTKRDAHPDMAQWADPASAWAPRPAGNGESVFWRKGEHFGDTTVHLPVPPMDGGARLVLSLAGDGKTARSGYSFVVQRSRPDRLAVQLQRAGETLPGAAASVGVPAEGVVMLTLMRRNRYLLADLEGGRRILKHADAAPLQGSRVGIQALGINIDLRGVRVRSRNVYDYVFHDAPVDWQPQAGAWEVMSRWSCQPGWSWFGGVSEGLAAIWNKRRFAGDLVLEYYAAPKMDAGRDPYAERFRDLNATICADGERLGSGYSFIVGGWRNTKTAILREGRVVAETAAFRLPAQKDGHREWFYVRIEKRGSRLLLWVDNKELLSYTDPAPLRGDRLALWTQNNGLIVARAVISYEQEKELPLVVRAPGQPRSGAAHPAAAAETAPVPLYNDFEEGMAQWRGVSARLTLDSATAAQGKRSLAVANAEPGGEFKAVAVAGRFNVAQAPRLSFDYRAPPDVRVNFYVRVGRAYYSVGFTGAGKVNPAVGVVGALGAIEGVKADNTWRRASFDLLAPLRRYFPNANPLHVEEVVLANWDPGGEGNDEYVWAGVTRNSVGARYHLDRFALGPMPSEALPRADGRSRGGGARTTAVVARAPALPRPAAAPAAPQKPVPASAPPRFQVVLSEDFSGGKSRVRCEAMSGKWEVNQNGHFAPTEKPEYAYAFTGDPGWTDYHLKADLINGQDAGLLVRAQDWNNCVFLVVRPAHKDLWWFVRRNGEWGGVLAPMNLDFGPKPVLRVKVSAMGDKITCYLDGKQASQIKCASFRKGRVGVYIKPDLPGQAWNNVEVILNGAAPPARTLAQGGSG